MIVLQSSSEFVVRRESVDWYLLNKALKNNVDKNISKAISTHRKKLKNLTKNAELPFSPNETVNNLSSYKLTNDELELLKNGLGFSIKPPRP